MHTGNFEQGVGVDVKYKIRNLILNLIHFILAMRCSIQQGLFVSNVPKEGVNGKKLSQK